MLLPFTKVILDNFLDPLVGILSSVKVWGMGEGPPTSQVQGINKNLRTYICVCVYFFLIFFFFEVAQAYVSSWARD